MNLLGYEVTFKRKNPETAGPPTPGDRMDGEIEEYYAPTSKAFSTYKTATGDTTITYDILEGLYRKTIMNKVINKLAGDATRLGYTVECINFKDEPHEQAKLISDQIDRMMTRKVYRNLYRDHELYGDAFLYKSLGKNGDISFDDIYCINPRYIEPDIQNQKFVGWKYSSSQGKTIPLKFEQIVHIPNNPLTGQLFGNSIFEPILQVLNLVLNSQVNSAVILEHLAIPLIHWQIDSKREKQKTPLTEIIDFIRNMGKTKIGADFVTDSSISSDVVSAADKMIDFTGMLDKLDDYLFGTSGVPKSIIGFPSNNLSSINKQLSTYNENLLDKSETVSDILITELYWPEMKTINDLKKIYFSYSRPTVEENSRTSTWCDTMLKDGVIYKTEARAALGYRGQPPAQPEVVAAPKTSEIRPDDKQNQEKPPVGSG